MEGARRGALPALDPSEQSFGPGPVPPYDVLIGALRLRPLVELPARGILHEDRHEILGVGEDERVRGRTVVAIPVAGKSPVGLAADSGQREAPAESERTVPSTRIVREGQRGAEPGPARWPRYRHAERSRAGGGVDAECFA